MSDKYNLEPEGNIDGIPRYIPSIVPAGEYLCQIAKSISQKTSPFDQSRSYFEWPMIFQDESGNKFDFFFNFTSRSEILRSILIVIGGKEIEKGMMDPPKQSVIGKYFMVEVTKEAKKGSTTEFRNKIVKVWPYVHKKEDEEGGGGGEEAELEANKAEFPKSKEEEIPF